MNQEANECMYWYSLRNRRNIKPPSKYQDYLIINEVEDISITNAMKDPRWKKAMQEEIESLKHMNSWVLVDLPEGRNASTCKWVLREKADVQRDIHVSAARFQ